MSDSDSFSSLMALVDSHLSKTNIQSGPGSEDLENGISKILLPSLSGNFKSTKEASTEGSFSLSPNQRLKLPTLSLSQSPIQEVLAKQVSNMLKAKEKREQEKMDLENQQTKLEKGMKNLQMNEQSECIIDLVKVIQESSNMESVSCPSEREMLLSSSSSFESLFESKFIDCDGEPEHIKTPDPLLPCITDMSYILKQKIRQGKCSTFGKVLTSRLRSVAAPYFIEKINTNIVHFDFSTKSPCDLIKEKLRKPQICNNHIYDVMNMLPNV